jgi:hypothetical protein
MEIVSDCLQFQAMCVCSLLSEVMIISYVYFHPPGSSLKIVLYECLQCSCCRGDL